MAHLTKEEWVSKLNSECRYNTSKLFVEYQISGINLENGKVIRYCKKIKKRTVCCACKKNLRNYEIYSDMALYIVRLEDKLHYMESFMYENFTDFHP